MEVRKEGAMCDIDLSSVAGAAGNTQPAPVGDPWPSVGRPCLMELGGELPPVGMCVCVLSAVATLQVVFIPVWLLLGAFVVGEVLYLVIVLLSYTLAENQQAMEERKLPDFILLFCSAIFSISLIVFMVCPGFNVVVR